LISDLLQTPAFDATSKRFCDICNIDVKIGLGGESNWTTHLNSGPHIRAQGTLQKNKVSNYFLKLTEQPDAGPSSSVIEPARLSSTILVPPSDVVQTEIANTADIIMIDDEHDSGRQAPDLPRSLIDRLRGATQRLPLTVPVGAEDDLLAQFSGAPFVDPSEYEDPWEMVDKVLNGVIGYGMSVAAVSAIIRRGRFGMDGLCDWLETCISEYGINPDLLEGKVERLLDAMSLLCVFICFILPNLY
jgi:hypothetical protein